MTTAVIEVGPAVVRGPGAVPPDLASTALDCIDDTIALVDDEPVSVDGVWADVMHAAAGEDPIALVLVCPTWWTTDQIERVRVAAASISTDVAVLQRFQVLSRGLEDPSWAVVEIAGELVVVSCADGDPVAFARCGETGALIATVVAAVGYPSRVIIDAPAEIAGAEPLGRAIAEQLPGGATASMADAGAVRRAAREPGGESGAPVATPVRMRWARGVGCAALVVAILGVGIAVDPRGGQAPENPTTTLVEGRVGVQIPAQWTVQRITDGPGSARVQVVSPTDADTAIHLTQSAVTPGQAQTMAETLRIAVGNEPPGVFADFDPAARIAERSVVSYREIRGERRIQWAVLVDGAVRIAIGCQSAVSRGETVRHACDTAIRSAHAVF